MLIALIGSSVIWPTKLPRWLASLIQGPMTAASSAVTVGMLSAFWHGAGQQVVRHLLGHLEGDVLLRLGGGGAEMRGADHVRQVEKRAVGRRFDLEHVEGCAGDVAGVQRLGQRRLVDQAATGAVDDAHALLGLGQVLARQDVAGLVGQRHVQGDEIGAGEKFVELDLGHAELLRALVRLRKGS